MPLSNSEAVQQPMEASNIDISGSTFTRVRLTGAVFHDVNLSGAAIDDANMTGWTVQNANMSGWAVTDVNFSAAQISHADLRNTSIVNCMTDGMTINGVAVADLMAAYRSRPPAASQLTDEAC